MSWRVSHCRRTCFLKLARARPLPRAAAYAECSFELLKILAMSPIVASTYSVMAPLNNEGVQTTSINAGNCPKAIKYWCPHYSTPLPLPVSSFRWLDLNLPSFSRWASFPKFSGLIVLRITKL